MGSAKVWVVLLLAPLVGVACDAVAPGDILCTTEAVAGIAVDVRDSVSDSPAGRGARIVARDGAYADTVQFTSLDGPYGLAYERAGSYTVTVQQQGYRVWSQSGIEVLRDVCHVRPVRLKARLQASAG